MNWIPLDSANQLDEIAKSRQLSIIFKHSTRCPISSMAKRNIEYERTEIPAHIPVYYLDLIRYRDLSNAIAQRWQVKHESPQVLLVSGDTCLYHASHGSIDIPELVKHIV